MEQDLLQSGIPVHGATLVLWKEINQLYLILCPH